jgi:DNA-binding MarR family transcriptional regulator
MKCISNLEDHLGYWLRYVSNQVSLSFRQRLAGEKITVGEWVVLRLLYEGEAFPAVLAEQIGVTRGAMTKIIDRLYEKNLIDRTELQDDRRFQRIAITKEGLALVPRLAQIADENEVFYFSHLSDAEKMILANLLKQTVEFHNFKNKPLD